MAISDIESGDGCGEGMEGSEDGGEVKEHEGIEEEIPASQFQESQGPVDEMQASPGPLPDPTGGIFNDTPSPERQAPVPSEVASSSSPLPVPKSSDVVLVDETPEKEKEKKQVWDEDVSRLMNNRGDLEDRIAEISQQLSQAKKMRASQIFGCFEFIFFWHQLEGIC